MVKQIITPLNNQVRQTHLSRLFFLSKGCTKVPLEKIRELVESGLGKQILDYAGKNPDIIKEATGFLSNIIYKTKE